MPSGSHRNLAAKGRQFEQLVADALRKEGLSYVKDANFEGLEVDFWLPTLGKKGIVVEAKSQLPRPGQLSRYAAQRRWLQFRTGADQVLIVTPGRVKYDAYSGIVGIRDLTRILERHKALPSEGRTFRHALDAGSAKVSPDRTFFASMPFDPKYLDTYDAITRAANAVGGTCRRIDEPEYNGLEIAETVRDRIVNTELTICDLSESKPNVLYELGFSDGLNHESVLVCSSPTGDLPLLVRNRSHLRYGLGQTVKLVDPLTEAIRAKLG